MHNMARCEIVSQNTIRHITNLKENNYYVNKQQWHLQNLLFRVKRLIFWYLKVYDVDFGSCFSTSFCEFLIILAIEINIYTQFN